MNIEKVAASLSEAQRNALISASQFLHDAAGEGIMIDCIDSEELIYDLAVAFGLSLEVDLPAAVRAHVKGEPNASPPPSERQ